MEKLPRNTLDLIKQLEDMFPDKMVVQDGDAFDRGKLAGAIELIRFLKRLSEVDEN
jgi:hypothetical protein